MQGLDVSFYQKSNIDWKKVKTSGNEFVYIKASEGIGRVEPFAHIQAEEAQEANIKVGYYHFSHIDIDKAVDEANFFLRVLSNLPKSDLIPVLDIETNKSNLSSSVVTQWCNDFIIQVKTRFPDVMLYTYTSFFDSTLIGKKLITDKLWIAQYGNNIEPKLPIGITKCNIWQYSQTGKVDGIGGNVDVNKAFDLPLV